MTLAIVALALLAGALLGFELAVPPQPLGGQVKAVGAQEPRVTPAGSIPAPSPSAR